MTRAMTRADGVPAAEPHAVMAAARAPATAAATALKGCVHAYRYTLRGIIGSHCRFYPSCSDYALEALSVHGAARGTLMTAKRILRCNPWNPGGYDPVPGPIPPKG